jgi:antitoxin HigA-1
MESFEIRNPSHPGEVLLEDVLPHYGMTISEAAKRLGMTRANLSNVLHGKAALSAPLAAKIEKAFGVNAEMLLTMMVNWSLAKARANPDLRSIERVPEPADQAAANF